jgi:hypothetical protein
LRRPLGRAAARRKGQAGVEEPSCRTSRIPRHRPASALGRVVVEKDLGDPGGFFQCGEVSAVGKRDRLGVSKQGEVGFTLRDE